MGRVHIYSMAALNSPPSTSPLRERAMPAEELTSRTEWMTTTPDPWVEIALLDYAGDRQFASTVNDMVVKAEFTQHAVLEKRLLGALATPGVTDAGRLFICRMLGLIGSATCVPELIPLLNDSATADVARLALDFIDDSAVTSAYRAALALLEGTSKAGLIGSIAMRGDTGALDALVAISVNGAESPEVRGAAERAMRKLGSKS
jgi:hypothetical protein